MRFTSARRQRGAFTIMSAFTLLLALVCLLLVVDSGRLYMEQRRLQRLADTAALEAVARLEQGDCAEAPEDAQRYAEENAEAGGFSSGPGRQVRTRCVRMVSQAGLRDAQASSRGRAVEVTLRHQVPASIIIQGASLFSSDFSEQIWLQAVAVAEREQPAASFSVGAQLLRLSNDKLLGRLLSVVGLNPERLTVLDSEGLADARITPSGLLRALGIKVGISQLKALSPEGLVDLVNTQVGLLGLDRLIDLSLELVSDSVLRLELELLRQEILSKPLIRDAKLQLFATADSPGLLSLGTSPDGSVGPALDAQVDLGQLLKTSLLIGASGRGLHIPELNVLGLVKVEAGIVEPPSIGVGPAGTQAYSAQVRLYVGIDSNQLLGGLLAWLTDTILGIRVNLPVWIDLVSGHGTLEEVDCTVSPPQATISVESDILNACVGKMPEALKWSGAQSCESSLQEDELVRLLHIPVLSGKTHIQALKHDDELTLAVGEVKSTSPNPLALGNTVDHLVTGLLDLLGGLFRKPNVVPDDDLDYSGQARNQLIAGLAEQYLEATKDKLGAKNGFYNVAKVTELILNGSAERDEEGNQLIPPLVGEDWFIEKSIPTTCVLVICAPRNWNDGNFSSAFHAYTSVPYSVLDLVGISTLGNGYSSCAGLLSASLNWNNCVKNNLTRLLQEKPGGINVSQGADGNNLLDLNTDSVDCSGALCVLLKPVLSLLKPILNGVGYLLKVVVSDVLGLELGRTDVELHAVSCGIPKLVR